MSKQRKLQTVSDLVAMLQQHDPAATVGKHQSFPMNFNVYLKEDGTTAFAPTEKTNNYEDAKSTYHLTVDDNKDDSYEVCKEIYQRVGQNLMVKDIVVLFRSDRLTDLLNQNDI